MVNVSAYIVPTRNRVKNILNPLKIDRLFYLSILGFIIPWFLKKSKGTFESFNHNNSKI